MGQAILMDRNQLDEQVLIALGAYRRHAGDSQRDELLGACAEWVTAFLQGRFRRQRDADLVADVSQEVLAVLCRKPSLSALASAHSPLGWLTRLSWFTAVNRLRRMMREAAFLRQLASETTDWLDTLQGGGYGGSDSEPERYVLAGEQWARIQRFVGALTPEEAALLQVLRGENGIKLSEAYRQLDWPPDHGKQIHRQLKRLAEVEFGPQQAGRRRREVAHRGKGS